ncbi:MAG: hypothetical protein KAT75_02700 [Dehalococcoidia bacterium]|nr:hypothetical protein [Dehalococcoidia bacterium]
MPKVLLKELAYTRSGDKGDISNVGILAFNKTNFEVLRKQITPQRVKEHYKDLVKGEVKVYEMPNIDALQVVMHNALGGGATKTLRWDETGKSMCLAMLYMEIEVPDGYGLGGPR